MNLNPETVEDFKDEWSRFDQSALSESEASAVFDQYFGIFPAELLNPGSEGADIGCGSGRWAKQVAPRVKRLHCIDPGDAIRVAQRNLQHLANVVCHQNSVDAIPLPDQSLDFAYCLGVLHHVPDTLGGLRSCVAKLKPGAPFLVYLYYSFENRPWWFRMLWRASDLGRLAICRLPSGPKSALTDLIAATVYWPFARLARFLEKLGMDVSSLPLSFYRDRSFYTMRTDARDRFGTHLEKRFSKAEIEDMMTRAGLERIRFSPSPPYWCALGFRAGM